MSALSNFLRDAVFYGIVDTGYVAENELENKCAQLMKSGCKIIQLRAKKENDAQRRKMAERLLPLFAKNNTTIFVINDDIELARQICTQIPNAGLHVGQDDIPPQKAREIIGENRVLGLSTHSIQQARAANNLDEILDYFAVGPVFATNTKPGRPAVGLELIKSVREMSPRLPWFAIGGVNLKTAASIKSAGAQRIVAVSDVLIPADTNRAVCDLLAAFNSADYTE